MNNIKDYNSVRLAIVSALIAFSVGLLAILHDRENAFGFFIIDGRFIAIIYNAFVILLICEIVLGIMFLLSTGYCYDFRDKEHGLSRRIQRLSYSWALGLFPASCFSVLYNSLIRVFGLENIVGVRIAVIISVLIILVIVVSIIVKREWKKKHIKRG